MFSSCEVFSCQFFLRKVSRAGTLVSAGTSPTKWTLAIRVAISSTELLGTPLLKVFTLDACEREDSQ